MQRHDKAPNGHFADGMILWGNLESGASASKGFVIEPPELRHASIAVQNEFQDKICIALSTLGLGQRVQMLWGCTPDYRKELVHYHQETGKVASINVRARRERFFTRKFKRMLARTLRKERLLLFFCQDSETSGLIQSHAELRDHYEKVVLQHLSHFGEVGITLQKVFGAGTTVWPMSDLEHFSEIARFFNPSLDDRPEINLEDLFRQELSIQEQCWNCDGVGLHNKPGFYLDGYYHTIFTIKRWPQKTYPGIVNPLTSLPFLDYRITVNIEPISVREEIKREEKAIDRLRGDYAEEGKHSMTVALKKKERKIESLAQGFSHPFSVQYAIHVWDRTESGLHAKCAAIKNAVNQMQGAQPYEAALPTTAKKLFFSICPGFTGSSYNHRHIYAEAPCLADMLPLSSTFTGWSVGPEALYEGNNGNLVGVKTFVGGSPQHAALFGTTGVGKSLFMADLLTQTHGIYHHTVIIEEGLSYKHFTESMGCRPILIHPDGELTINYLDTQGSPLSQLQIASAVALISKMIGEPLDPEKQQLRQAQIGQYVSQLFSDWYVDWSIKHSEKIPGLQRMACAVHKWRGEKMALGTTFLEAFADFRDGMKSNNDEVLSFHDALSEDVITRFLKEPQTERFLMQTAYSEFTPEEYPTHTGLIEQMLYSRLPEHRKEEIDQIATLLSPWTASGQYGKLFDGTTNISLTDNIAHFELGYIPEQAVELKTAAGLLISGFTRQHIITLPRHLRKRIIFEEVSRFLDVPGGEKIVAEGYAQMRKFNCWIVSIVQQYSKFKSTRIRPVIMGNSKQFFLMRQFDRSDLDDIARDIQLPEAMVNAIQHYPLPEQQAEGQKFSSVCYYSPAVQPPLCGTLRHIVEIDN